ncbi:hypothetical protein ACFWYW_57535 [Nonomuraea sp. NPDC059023]|uniref:hypothetical protein n=1 Tax=unclassified Nonomuraea TaxID=2593643 RepID=UPI0036B7F6C2
MNDVAEFVHEATRGTWLIWPAIAAILAVGAGVVWMWRRTRKSRPGRGPDRVERTVRDALAYEADQQMLRRGVCPDEDLDGMACDWDSEMRRRDRRG